MNRKGFCLVMLTVSLISVSLWTNVSQAWKSQNPNTPRINLGQPGLSFRYLEMFGHTDQPYISDTSHHNFPSGVGTDGTTIWIAEGGRRALKFASDGSYQGVQIGNTGHDIYQDQIMWDPSDVTVDTSGNVWLAISDSNHILKFDATGDFLFELGETWEWGSDNDHFGFPVSVAFDSSGNIYVSDGMETWTGGNQRIQIFDSTGVHINTIGETGVAGSDNNHFREPHRIAIDDSDLLYIADFNNHRIQIFDVSDPLSPSYVATIGVTGVSGNDNAHFDSPTGVDVDSNYIYVSDESNNRVQIFNRSTLGYVDTIGTGWGGPGNDQFQQPTDVAVDSDGNIYVADSSNVRVQQFNSSWNYVRTFGVTGVPYITNGYHYNGPSGLAITPDGKQYILEGWGQRLLKLDSNGDPLWAIGEPGMNGDDNQHFAWGGDVGFDSSENVYVADKANHRVQVYTSEGLYVGTLGITGNSGTGNNQFNNPFGVGIAPNDDIYIADGDNHRIQIFDNNRTYKATLGETGVSGADNSHFNNPEDVIVNSQGIVYVADSGNHRIQVYDANRNYLKTLGVTGESGEDFDHFNSPYRLAIDLDDNLYVVDTYNSRIQVFDSDGKYLTTIGSFGGSDTAQLDTPYGIGLDSVGNVYVTNRGNSRTLKFAPNVPNWKQVNINGFGKRHNTVATNMEIFNNQLYVGTGNWGDGGAEVWRTTDGTTWVKANETGFGETNVDANAAVVDFATFNNQLYASTGWRGQSGQIWRSTNGLTWTQVEDNGFDDPGNEGINIFGVFNNQLYVSIQGSDGVEIWRSSNGNDGSWVRMVENGGSDNLSFISDLIEFNGKFYAMVENNNDPGTGCQVWESADGANWMAVVDDGFGNTGNSQTGGADAFNGWLYVGTRNDATGGEIWRSNNGTGWEIAANGGFGDVFNEKIENIFVYKDFLYATTVNYSTGFQIWRSKDGTTWEPYMIDGFGDTNNNPGVWTGVEFKENLFLGSNNDANGTKIWQTLNQVYLPMIVR